MLMEIGWNSTYASLAAQLRVGGLPDLAHAALADEGGDVVVPEAGAGGEWHWSTVAAVLVILRASGPRLHLPARIP